MTATEQALQQFGEDFILTALVRAKDDPVAPILFGEVQGLDQNLFSKEAQLAISQLAARFLEPPEAVQTH